MIKAEIGCNGKTRVEGRGTVNDLIYDTCVLISEIWNSIKKGDQHDAAFCKYAMTRAFTDEDSPLWRMAENWTMVLLPSSR